MMCHESAACEVTVASGHIYSGQIGEVLNGAPEQKRGIKYKALNLLLAWHLEECSGSHVFPDVCHALHQQDTQK